MDETTKTTGEVGTGSILEKFLLGRLARFADLSSPSALGDLSAAQRLAQHAVFSAYRDCVAVGLRAEAAAVLARSAHRPVRVA